MLLDVTAAFLLGDCERPLFMELPQEDPRSSDPNLVARLIKSLYGTRDAPQLWAKHVGKTLRGLGYTETKGAPGVYYHKEKDVEITLHVDDFLVVGEEEHLMELKAALEKVYKLKGKVLGPDEGDSKEGVYLGRRIYWREWGIELEGNPKHIQELLKTTGMESCKPVSSPMTAEDYKDDDSKKTDLQRRELTGAEAKLYRRGTALCVYISQDRGDISAATCQLATRMQTPTEYDWERLKRVCRYLKGSPRFRHVYRWQAEEDVKLRLLTDSDWANEARSRKSHSGGVLLAGGHLLQHWCRRQPVVALSSGEAEVYSGVCGLTRLIGISNILKEMRGECWGNPMEHAVDASTCKSILLRRGPGGIKHLDTKQLWVQEAITEKSIRVLKINREENPADTLASYSNAKVMQKHIRMMGCEVG